jgi:DNA helicase-2/ATP-dependent DNA helicase PcrA
LEFSRVIMTGLEQGVFPREDKKDEEMEEERRLFYVGATRAMDELYLCSCAERRMYGRTAPVSPSVFLREIDKNCLRVIGNASGNFGGAVQPCTEGRQDRGSPLPPRTPVRQAPPLPHRHPWEAGYAGGGKSRGESDAERRAGWRRGQRLYHDDHGYGSVVEVKDSGEGPVVRVQFETGRELRFLSEHQGGAFDKIGDDD